MNVLGLVQLVETESVGNGYAQWCGIDRLAQRGALRNREQVLALVHSVLEVVIGPTQGIAAGIAFRAARQSDPALLPALTAVLSSDLLPAPLRMASLQMGVRLWEVSRRWNWTDPIHEQFDPVIPQAGLHSGVAFGALVSETTAHEVRAIAACLFQAAKALIGAAVRAIPLDESIGQRLLSQVQPAIGTMAVNFSQHNPADIRAVDISDFQRSIGTHGEC